MKKLPTIKSGITKAAEVIVEMKPAHRRVAYDQLPADMRAKVKEKVKELESK